jgi:hypothetical protein
VLSRLFRRLFLEGLTDAYQAGRLEFFADQAALAEPDAFQTFLAALRNVEWVVYAKRPFDGPDAVFAYLSRYTHRIAIANRRLVAFNGERVTFRWKDYRAKADARSSFEAFRTPAPVHPLAPTRGRHPKTLNGSRRSSRVPQTAAADLIAAIRSCPLFVTNCEPTRV